MVAAETGFSNKPERLEVVAMLHWQAVLVNEEAGSLVQPRVDDLDSRFESSTMAIRQWPS